MDQAHFLAYSAGIVVSFVWIQWQRKSGRLSRVIGVVVIMGVALAAPWLVQRVG